MELSFIYRLLYRKPTWCNGLINNTFEYELGRIKKDPNGTCNFIFVEMSISGKKK